MYTIILLRENSRISKILNFSPSYKVEYGCCVSRSCSVKLEVVGSSEKNLKGSPFYDSRALGCVSDDATYRMAWEITQEKQPGRVDRHPFSMSLNQLLQNLQNEEYRDQP